VKFIPPGKTIGIVGAGQLGRMSAIAARQLGYRLAVFDQDAEAPTACIADHVVVAPLDDLDAARKFARLCDVVTFEFENIPADTLRGIQEITPVHPSPEILHTTRHRIREKNALTNIGVAVAPYASINEPADIHALLERFGPGIAKTCELGYDGKGQFRLSTQNAIPAELIRSIEQGTEFVFEQLVPFEHEISVIVARNDRGDIQTYEPFENVHTNHILDLTIWPASVSQQIQTTARSIATSIAERLDLVGLMCVEMFVKAQGELIVNELAPRPHNSGHITMDAAVTGQFEQHIRAVTGLPLGSTGRSLPAAMANLLGDLWFKNGKLTEPDFAAALSSDSRVKLHLYGKSSPRPGRKMGHLNATSDSTTSDSVTLNNVASDREMSPMDSVIEARKRL